jgi:hypothetical protein
MVIIIGSLHIVEADLSGSSDVLILVDPPEGHMVGPKYYLKSLDQLAETRRESRGFFLPALRIDQPRM